MIIVCNGSHKSGSTWLVQIVRGLGVYSKVPERYQHPDWKNSSIKSPDIILQKKLSDGCFYSKQHWANKEIYSKVASLESVKVLNIVRDLRDMIVSRYFHEIRNNMVDVDLHDFFKLGHARDRVEKYIQYHYFWHVEYQDLCHLSSYEGLLDDFQNGCREILNYIDPEIILKNPEIVSFLYGETAFKNQKLTGDGHFLRKGKSGDWRNHLSESMEVEILQIAKSNKWDEVKKTMIDSYPHTRSYLSQSDLPIV